MVVGASAFESDTNGSIYGWSEHGHVCLSGEELELRLNAGGGIMQPIRHFPRKRHRSFNLPFLRTGRSVVVAILEGSKLIAFILASRKVKKNRRANYGLSRCLVVQDLAFLPIDRWTCSNPVGEKARTFEESIKREEPTERMADERPA